MTAALFLFVLGVLGIAGMTVLFPLLGVLVYYFTLACRNGSKTGELLSNRVAVLIPVHDEVEALAVTLASVRQSFQSVTGEVGLSVQIFVGCDGCSDASAAIAAARGAVVKESSVCQGKWKTLQQLLEEASSSEWVALVDAGAVWPQDLVVTVRPLLDQANVLTVAPSYRNPRGGTLEALAWWLERFCKGLENRAGGPVSIHGATVFYRRLELVEVLNRLAGRNWLNDDVVLPLLLRASNPRGRLVYLPDCVVSEGGVGRQPKGGRPIAQPPAREEYLRRRRMVVGNLDWIEGLLPEVWRCHRLVGLLALRRVCRVFWVYWFIFVGTAALLALQHLAGVSGSGALTVLGSGAALVVLFALSSNSVRRLGAIALVSLLAPWYACGGSRGKMVRWR